MIRATVDSLNLGMVVGIFALLIGASFSSLLLLVVELSWKQVGSTVHGNYNLFHHSVCCVVKIILQILILVSSCIISSCTSLFSLHYAHFNL